MQQKTLVLVLFLVVIAGGLFFLMRRAAPLPSETTTATTTALAVSTTTISQDAPKYTVSLVYPHFNLPAIDQSLDLMLASTTATFISEANADTSGQSAKYDLESMFDSVYSAPDVVSTRLVVSTYTGGAHPNSSVIGLNFDPQTGRALSLNDALALIGKTLPQVAASSLAQLQASSSPVANAIQFPDGAAAAEQNYSAFTISKDRVTFYFQPYQVAAYAAGILTSVFPRVK